MFLLQWMESRWRLSAVMILLPLMEPDAPEAGAEVKTEVPDPDVATDPPFKFTEVTEAIRPGRTLLRQYMYRSLLCLRHRTAADCLPIVQCKSDASGCRDRFSEIHFNRNCIAGIAASSRLNCSDRADSWTGEPS